MDNRILTKLESYSKTLMEDKEINLDKCSSRKIVSALKVATIKGNPSREVFYIKPSELFEIGKQVVKQKRSLVTTEIQWPTAIHHKAFLYWNKLGPPFKRHQEKPTRIIARANRLITKWKKNHTTIDSLFDAMDIAKTTFNSSWFSFYNWMNNPKYRISLDTFIEYEKGKYDTLSNYTKSMGVLPLSWAEECSRGIRHMRKKYNLLPYNRYPGLHRTLAKFWKDFSRTTSNIDSPEIQAQLIKWSNYAGNFCYMNFGEEFTNEGPMWGPFYGGLQRVLEVGDIWFPDDIDFVVKKTFFTKTATEMISKRDPVRYHNFNYNTNWREITKNGKPTIPKNLLRFSRT